MGNNQFLPQFPILEEGYFILVNNNSNTHTPTFMFHPHPITILCVISQFGLNQYLMFTLQNIIYNLMYFLSCTSENI